MVNGMRIAPSWLLATLLMASAAWADVRQTDAGFVVVGSEQIYYESTGSGEAVVFSHGAGGNHAIWVHQTPVFAETYRVVTWDQRGWGKSTDVRGLAGDSDTAVEDLRRLLDHLDIDRAHLVGQSMGGWAVAGFALRYPERTRSLVLANTYGGLSTEAMREWITPDRWAEVRERAAKAGRDFDIMDPVLAFRYGQISRLAPPRGPANLGELLFGTHWDLDEARKSSVPILIVTGPYDMIFAPEMMRLLDAELPTSRLVEIPDSGHSPYFERPDAWNHAVLEHLGG